jgi:hypothetical protein
LYYGYTNNMAVRRESFAALGPFVEQARGADTIFVRRVVDAYSCEAVRYEPNVRIQHLEMDSVWKHYRKMWLYGRSNRLSQPLVSQRPLTRSEARQVFAETVRDQGYSRPRAHLLSVLTTLEGASYVAGQLAAKWSL